MKEKFILLDPIHEEYLQIYHEYYVLNWQWHEIAKYHDCSVSKVSTAIKWVDKNKLKIPAKSLLAGAITAVKVRLKKNKELHETEYTKKRQRNHRLLIELNRELREDEKLLFKLQDILSDKYDTDLSTSAAGILQAINDAVADQIKTKQK